MKPFQSAIYKNSKLNYIDFQDAYFCKLWQSLFLLKILAVTPNSASTYSFKIPEKDFL